ncbi:MAG: hypothetical protein WCS88_04030 [Patescibacteria group bacterium]|jgi:hypothetical protein
MPVYTIVTAPDDAETDLGEWLEEIRRNPPPPITVQLHRAPPTDAGREYMRRMEVEREAEWQEEMRRTIAALQEGM